MPETFFKIFFELLLVFIYFLMYALKPKRTHTQICEREEQKPFDAGDKNTR